MPSYPYAASGGLKFSVCSKYWKTINYPHKWSPGDVLFSKLTNNININCWNVKNFNKYNIIIIQKNNLL